MCVLMVYYLLHYLHEVLAHQHAMNSPHTATSEADDEIMTIVIDDRLFSSAPSCNKQPAKRSKPAQKTTQADTGSRKKPNLENSPHPPPLVLGAGPPAIQSSPGSRWLCIPMTASLLLSKLAVVSGRKQHRRVTSVSSPQSGGCVGAAPWKPSSAALMLAYHTSKSKQTGQDCPLTAWPAMRRPSWLPSNMASTARPRKG